MKYLKEYKLFESKYDEEILDIFNNICINTQTSSFEFRHGTDNTIHIVWGERIEFDDHQLLKNLYDYREILNKMYNMEYFYIYMNESLVIVVLHDLMVPSHNMKSYVPYIRLSRSKMPNVPSNIFGILDNQQSNWRGYSALQPGIRKTNGDSSNLALFDWIYKDKVTEKISHNELDNLLDYLDDIFVDLKEEGYKLDYSGHLLNLRIVKPKIIDNTLFNSYQRYKASDVHSTILTMDRYIRSYGLIPVSIYLEDALSTSKYNTHCNFDLSRYNIDDVLTNFNMVMEIKIEYKEDEASKEI